ncbi:MAG: FAD-dependent oxidoreductase [Catenulispora sp.]|nr:FAD-dependent oxidoreductase [Catenulispora sp.]
MTAPADAFDVLIVGAGPAGAAAAVTAARAGLSVLLADDSAPRPAGDVVLSAVAARRLAELGATVPGTRPAGSVELCFPGRSRQVTGIGTTIAETDVLRAALADAAIAAGAESVTGRVELPSNAADGDRAVLDGMPIRARHIVLATGAAGTTTPAHATGIACAQRFAGIDITDRIVLAPLRPAAEPGAQPAMLTVLPGPDGTVTVWLTRRGAGPGTSPLTDATGLLQDALATLAAHDRRFAAACPTGSAVHAAVHSGFSPDLLEHSEALVVGDAAGLANPFTGEGIGAALLSGMLAGQAVAAHTTDANAARRRYARQLAGEFVGFFETARHATRRYHLVWRTLDAAAASDHTVFAKARRAVLLPEELPGLAGDRVPITPADRVVTGPFLVACDEVGVATLRAQWPFLARLLVSGAGPARHRIRPALLFLAGLLAEDRMPAVTRATPAAAVELATFGALAFLGTESAPAATRNVDWAGATLVMAGDFLMSRASSLIAESAPEASWALADWMAELAACRAARLGDRPGPATDLHSLLMEFPARLGALLGGASADTVKVLRTVGGLLGEAFTHAEDVLALTGRRTRLDMTLQAALTCRSSAIPDLTGSHPDDTGRLLADPAFAAEALDACKQACSTTLTRVHAAIADVPGALARRILTAYAIPMEVM